MNNYIAPHKMKKAKSAQDGRNKGNKGNKNGGKQHSSYTGNFEWNNNHHNNEWGYEYMDYSDYVRQEYNDYGYKNDYNNNHNQNKNNNNNNSEHKNNSNHNNNNSNNDYNNESKHNNNNNNNNSNNNSDAKSVRKNNSNNNIPKSKVKKKKKNSIVYKTKKGPMNNREIQDMKKAASNEDEAWEGRVYRQRKGAVVNPRKNKDKKKVYKTPKDTISDYQENMMSKVSYYVDNNNNNNDTIM